MKKLFHYLSVFAIAALTLTGCDDVPMPYNQPEIKPDEPSAEVTPKGSGTAADPYNVAAVLQVIQGLEGDNTTDQIYVKGAVKSIRQIETEQYGNANYYITDDGNNQVYIFQSYYLGNRKFTAEDKLEVGDTVVVCGKFYNYSGNTPETVGRGTSYIYSLNGKTSGGDTPTPTPTPGEAKGDGTQANPYNVAAVLKLYEDNSYDSNKDVYVTGTIHKIGSIDTGQYGNATYYISDDGTSGNDYEIYRGYYFNGDKFTSSDQLKVGDVVVVCGKLTMYMSTKEMAQGSRIITINGKTSGGDTPDTPDTPATGEALSISGTTVTITNTGTTAGSETASINFAEQGLENAADVTEFTLSDGTKIVFDGNGQRNGPKYYNGTKGIRVYLNNIITFKGTKKIAKIVMNCDSYSGTDYVGNKGASVTFSGNDVVYTNSDESVTSGGGVQLRVKTITITYAK